MVHPDDDMRSFSQLIPVSATGLRPRIVLGLLLVGSFIGIWIAHWRQTLLLRGVLWVVVLSLGALVGGLYWRLMFFDGTGFEDATTGESVKTRWGRLETTCIWAVVLTGSFYFLAIDPSVGVDGAVLGIWFTSFLLLWFVIRFSDAEGFSRTRAYLRGVLLFQGIASLAGVAWIGTGTTLVDWVIRLVHFGSFSLWLGGAAWHNFIVLPAVTTRPAGAAALQSQARGFRRYLPVIISLLFLTGIYQTIQLFGIRTSGLLNSSIGRLIGLKVLILVVLSGLVLVALIRNSRTG